MRALNPDVQMKQDSALQVPEIVFQTTGIHVTSDSIDNLIFALKDKGYQVEDLTEPFGIKAFRISR